MLNKVKELMSRYQAYSVDLSLLKIKEKVL